MNDSTLLALTANPADTTPFLRWIASAARVSVDQAQQDIAGIDIKPLAPGEPVYEQCRDYVLITAASARIGSIYSVRIPAERERFKTEGKPIGNVRTLMHGASAASVLLILKSGGFRLPTSVGNGKLYGWGVYFAGHLWGAYKALSYARNNDTRLRVLFLCDVALGKIYEAPRSMPDLRQPPMGFDSVQGVEHKINDTPIPELIVYNPAQITIRAIVTLVGKGVRQ